MNPAPVQLALRLLLLLALLERPAPAAGTEPAPAVVSSSGDYLIQNWQAEEGLPRNTINCLAQDREGYLWMGTPEGLIRFDGVRFVALEGRASPLLAKGWVQSLFCDQAGVLWIATRRSGLLQYRDGQVTPSPPLESGATDGIDSVAQDGRGTLWLTEGNGVLGRLAANTFATTAQLYKIARGPMLFKLTTDAAGGLWFYKQNTYGRLVDGHPTNVTSYPDSVITLAPSHTGGLWVSTGRNLRRIPAGQTVASEAVVAPLPFSVYDVSVLYEDRSGTLWVGTTDKGLFRFHGGKLESVALLEHNIRGILEDAEDNLWVGTDGAGLFKLKPRVFNLLGKQDGLPRNNVVSICGDWVAPAGTGCGRITPAGQVAMIHALDPIGILSLMDDGAGGMWLGTGAGRLLHETGDGQFLPEISVESKIIQLRVLHRDQRGDLWIGGFPHGLFRLVQASGPPGLQNLSSQGFTNVSVTALAEEAQGVIWIGTSKGDLWRFEHGNFQEFGAAQGLPGFPIGALLTNADGTLWVGTLGGGLGLFKAGKARFLGEEAGLIDNVISQLIRDEQGWLWIGSSRGLARTRESELRAVLNGDKPEALMVHYGRADGLANLQCASEHQPSAWLTRQGVLRVATSRGVVSVDTAAIPLNQRPPPLALETVLVDGREVTNRTRLKLPYNYNKIEFRYTALSFVAPENVRFKRRLWGFDEDWVAADTQRSATYPRLPPGRYTFAFNACNNDGVWAATPFQLEFRVVPAFWQTLWFRAAVVGAFTILVAGVVRYAAALKLRRALLRLEQEHLLERERTRISRDLHDDLGARLTQMAFLTDLAAEESGAPAAMRTQLRGVSRQARNAVQALDETVWMINPRKDTLPHLIAYLATYAEQFFQATTIACRQDICRHPPGTPLPGKLRRDIFLLVKESLNNVLKHSGAAEVWLRIAVRGPVLRIVIQDDGRGFVTAEPDRQRNGLENLRRRAEETGVRFRLRSAPGHGTRLVFCAVLGETPPHSH